MLKILSFTFLLFVLLYHFGGAICNKQAYSSRKSGVMVMTLSPYHNWKKIPGCLLVASGLDPWRVFFGENNRSMSLFHGSRPVCYRHCNWVYGHAFEERELQHWPPKGPVNYELVLANGYCNMGETMVLWSRSRL